MFFSTFWNIVFWWFLAFWHKAFFRVWFTTNILNVVLGHLTSMPLSFVPNERIVNLLCDIKVGDENDEIDQLSSTEDGNETSSVCAHKKQENLGKVFMFRFGKQFANKGILDPWIKEHCTRATFQAERGDKEGYLHWQMTVELKTRKRWTWFKHHFLNGVYAERVRNEEASFDYANKFETRIEGPYQYPAPIEMPTDYFREEHCIPFEWQVDLEHKLRGPADGRTVFWFWSDEGLSGKTIFARHLLLSVPGMQYCKGFKRDVFMTLNTSTRGVIINFARGDYFNEHTMTMLEDLKDGLIFSSKYESRAMIVDRLHIVVFANEPPNTLCRNALSGDRLIIEETGATARHRRVQEIQWEIEAGMYGDDYTG